VPRARTAKPRRVDDLLKEVCHRVMRNITPAEWKEHVGDGEKYVKTCPDLP
jgi:hypothetical protein